MVVALKSLHFTKGKVPAKQEQERVVQKLATLLGQAATIGHEYARDETQRGIAWGSKGNNPLASAWDIVSNFVVRIMDWFGGQDEDISEEDVEAEVESLAETVAGVEVASEIESTVMDTLQEQGVLQITWIAQGNACPMCLDNAAASPLPIGSEFPSGDSAPPAHSHCRCSLGTQG